LNKNKKIAITTTTIALIIIALATATYYQVNTPAQINLLPQQEPPQAQIKITGEFQTQKTLSIKELTQMPLTNITTTIKGETANYLGVTLLELLNKTSTAWDTGLINVISTDGFNKTITLYQAYNSTQYPGSEIILAFAKNSKWITDTTEGPLKLITPALASAYNVKSVTEINLQPSTITITGAVSNPIVLTGQNITSFETKTVQATLAPGGEPQRTSTWTGTNLWNILQTSGTSSNASKVTVYAIDGYSKEFTITQVKNLGILIGYQENNAYLTPVNGQPYRLVVPTEDFKWGQYWVRWVSQIIVA
jgi:DMSO/TMAO reductase YedYZ molybdopterin-dependent catalytic subunit